MPIVVFRRLRSFVWKFHFIIDNWSICFSVNLANLWNKIIFTNLSFPFKWIWVIKKWLLQYTDTNKCVYKYINVYIYIYIYIYHTHTHTWISVSAIVPSSLHHVLVDLDSLNWISETFYFIYGVSGTGTVSFRKLNKGFILKFSEGCLDWWAPDEGWRA